MNLKTTYILFGMVIVVLLVVGLLQIFSPKSPTQGSEWVFPDLVSKEGTSNPSDMDSLRVERTGKDKSENLLFVRGDKGWELREPSLLRVDNYQVEDLVRKLMSAKREDTKTSTNLADYGLDDPAVVLTLQKGDKEYTLRLGGQTFSTVIYGVSSADPKKAIAIKKASLDAAYKPLADFRSKELLTASPFLTSLVKLTGAKGEELVVVKTGNRWKLEKPDAGDADYDGEPGAGGRDGMAKRITGVHELLDQIGAVRVETDADFIAEGVSEGALAGKYGLEAGKPELLRIEVKSGKEASKPGEAPEETAAHVLLVGKKAAPDRDKDGKETKTDYVYARLESENAVVRVPSKKIEQLVQVIENPSELRDHNLLTLETHSIDAIDVQSASGLLLKLRKPSSAPQTPFPAPMSPRWKLFRDSGAGQDAHDESVDQLLTALLAKRQIKTWPDPKDPKNGDKELDFDHPTAVISLWENGIAPPEKKEEKKDDDKKDDKKTEKKDDKKDDKKEAEKPKEEPPKLKSDKPAVRLVFGKRDKDKGILYVRRELGDDLKTTTLVTIPDTLYDKVTAGPLAYLSRKLPSFAEQPSRVTITRDGQTFVLEKGDKSYWTIKEPKDLAGRRANGDALALILSDLQFLKAERLVTENPPDGDLHPLYDLKPPVVEVKVTVPATEKDKTEEIVYQFGKEDGDKKVFFAKMSKNNLVFTVPKTVVDNAQKDLRDPAIFAFETAEVKKLKLVFWLEATAEPYTLEMERKEGGLWSVSVPPGFMNFDDSKAESFVRLVAGLKAEKTLTGAEVPKPEQAKFDLKAGALLVEITLAGKDKPVQLTVGGDVEKKAFYAKSSLTGDDVFLVPLASFDPIKGKPSYFKKQ